MTQWKFNELSDLGEGLSAPSDVVVTNLIKIVFFFLAFDRLAFIMNNGLGSNLANYKMTFHTG